MIMSKKQQGNTNRPIGNRNICGSDYNNVLEKSNVNIVHSNASSYNFVIGASLIAMMTLILALSGFMLYSANAYKKEIDTRLDNQDMVISDFISQNKR